MCVADTVMMWVNSQQQYMHGHTDTGRCTEKLEISFLSKGYSTGVEVQGNVTTKK